ncbi:prostaglandin E synthase 2-like [Coffea eugenioides]|uniref:Prostaglandin E synthase 2 n=1 Tax=Coffea arabica TaxID=13443 RepID=A0ABM4W0Z8_COFAR|nr:prostaglandin E synthase 2-like [Coffea eugenioides]
MRRIGGLVALCRAAEGIATSSTAGNVVCNRMLQTALYGTTSAYSRRHHWFTNSNKLVEQPAAHTVAGTMLFSVAASAVSEDVHAKEPVQPKLRPNDVVLYQYEACPFCNKVKAFLDYYDIPYKVVEVNPISKKEIKWSGYKKVPILMVDGEQMIDSSEIIDELSRRVGSRAQGDNLSDEAGEENKWRGWVDNQLVHVLSPNIYRSSSEALESFDYITSHGNFSFTERIIARYAGAAAMYFVSKKLKKRHNITDERAALYDAAETWVDALKGRDFLGGSKPNLADLAVFGVLRPIRHLQSGKDMVEHTRIGEWYSRMEDAVGAPCRLETQGA